MAGPVHPLPPARPPAAAGAQRPQGIHRRQPFAAGGEENRLKTACREMEALFIHRLLAEMRKSVVKSGLIDGGRAEEIYTSLMDAETAKHVSESGGLGLSGMLLEQLSPRSAGQTAPGADPPAADARSTRDRRSINKGFY
ncbi:MAG: rod-binding protein [Desulfobacterales bacterium]|nr:rod-binding protein [Desulfobacterales bacterium]